MGMFDDLVPPGAPSQKGGMFDDLVPVDPSGPPAAQMRSMTPEQIRQIVTERQAAHSTGVRNASQIFDKTVSGGNSFGRLANEISADLKGGIRKDIGEITGGTVGGIAAPLAVSSLVGPMGPLAAAGVGVLGAVAGGMAGKKVQSEIDPYSDGSWWSVLSAGYRQGRDELVGRGVTGTLLGVGKGISTKVMGERPVRHLTNASPLMQEVGVDFAERGGKLLPTQRGPGLVSSLTESIARGSFGSKQMFRQFDAEQAATAARVAKEWADELAGSPRDLTRLGSDVLESIRPSSGKRAIGGVAGRKLGQIDDAINPLYKEIEQRIPSRMAKASQYVGDKSVPTGILDSNGQMITMSVPQYAEGAKVVGYGAPTSGFKNFAKERRAVFAATPGMIPEAEEQLFKNIDAWPENIPWSNMQALRSEFIEKSWAADKSGSTSGKIYKRLSALADDAILDDRGAAGLPPDLRNLVRKANAVTRKAHTVYEDAFKKGLADKLSLNPELVLDFLLTKPKAGGEGPITQINLLKEALSRTPIGAPDPEGALLWKRIQDSATQGVIAKAARSGALEGKTLTTYMNDMGPAAMEALHGGRGIAVVKRAKALSDLTSIRESSASLIVRAAQGGAVAGMGGYKAFYGETSPMDMLSMSLTTGLIIMGPRTLTRLMTSDSGYDIVRKLTLRGATQKEAGPLIVRAVGLLAREDRARKAQMEAAHAQRVWKDAHQNAPTMEQLSGFGGRGY